MRELQERVATSFPELHTIDRGDTVAISGWLPLSRDGRVVDRYQVEVELPRTYPKGLPIVRETAGRIPREPDRHMNKDGTACVMVTDEFWMENPNGIDAVDFLNGPVVGFFAGQALLERGQPWPGEERSHGWEGILEYYRKLLHTDDVRSIIRYLEVLSIKKVHGHVPCPCGSGRRLNGCHRAYIAELRSRIPRKVALKSLNEVKRGFFHTPRPVDPQP